MINRIVIDNFKSIRHLDLELRPLNVLIGANGSGKSNLIGFLEMWKKLGMSDFHNYVRQKAGANHLLHFGYAKSEFISGKFFLDNQKSYYFRLMPDNADDFFFETERLEMGEGKFEQVRNKPDSQLATEISEYRPDIHHFIYTGERSFLRQKSSIDNNAYLAGDGSNLPSVLYLIQKKHTKVFNRIEAIIKSASPFFDGFNLAPDPFNNQYIKLKWRSQNEEFPFDASHLSDGTLRFIALTTVLLHPDPPKLVVIDEPELGLHPSAINKLAGLIKKAALKTQVIIATQSSQLVDNFEPEDIVTVGWEDGQSTFKRHSTEELSAWLEDYSMGEIWNKNVIGGRP